jgi:hypothetical protein
MTTATLFVVAWAMVKIAMVVIVPPLVVAHVITRND